MYNEDCTHIISHLLKNLIGFAFVSAYIILGKNKLVIICFWIQEFFYSLNDIMKAFIILLATDYWVSFTPWLGTDDRFDLRKLWIYP
nr:envelope membrane carbon uptake protein [Cathaya argyrophylla]ULF47578.1 envelope membrane carbon uptake protein [Cathaya argyrophylla]